MVYLFIFLAGLAAGVSLGMSIFGIILMWPEDKGVAGINMKAGDTLTVTLDAASVTKSDAE
jgi:hypothetical protein